MAEAGTPAKFVMSSRGGDPESAHVTTSKDVLVLAASAPAPTIAKVVDMAHYESATDWFGKDSVAGRLYGANLGALPGVTLLVEGQAADDPSHAWSRMGASIDGLTSEYAEFALEST